MSTFIKKRYESGAAIEPEAAVESMAAVEPAVTVNPDDIAPYNAEADSD